MLSRMQIREFGVEAWMNRYETRCAYNLAETCVDSLTVDGLLALTGTGTAFLEGLRPLRLSYGAIEGSERLRRAIAALYRSQRAENVLVTHGAIGANALVHATLVEPGDVVVSIVPTYQQHDSIPESYGAQVRRLRLREEEAFLPDLDALRRLADGPVRLIAFANPNNPTGALMDRAMLEEVTRIAERCGAWVLCDEVYRGTDQEGDGFTASIADLSERGISTGSMSKTWALAGLRLGWIAGPVPLLRRIAVHRDYTTISVGMIDDAFATLALEHRDALLARNQAIVRTNLDVLDGWMARQERLAYVKPRSGTTALLRYDADMPSYELCVRLLESTGVLLTPGSAMDVEGCLRIGYANDIDVLRQGLERLGPFIAGLREGVGRKL
jgi:aspartate/methionine/tyrosine aminotransferase